MGKLSTTTMKEIPLTNSELKVIVDDNDYENERFNLGTFNTIEEAAKAYNAKAKELFGDFAFQNPIL